MQVKIENRTRMENQLLNLLGVLALRYGKGALIVSATGSLDKRVVAVSEQELAAVKNVRVQKDGGRIVVSAEGVTAARPGGNGQ